MDIDKIIKNIGAYTIEEFFQAWEGQKDVFIIKYDGLREDKKYTILLLAYENRFNTIHIECEKIMEGIEDVLRQYKSILIKMENGESHGDIL